MVLIFIIRSRNGILDIVMPTPTYVCYVYDSTKKSECNNPPSLTSSWESLVSLCFPKTQKKFDIQIMTKFVHRHQLLFYITGPWCSSF
jgi:hypothetical protein